MKFFKSDAIVVKKGAAIEIPAEILGLPLPTFEWTKNGVVIDAPTETMTLESEEINRQTINTKIGIPETVRQDTGIYKLTATNIRGTGQRTIRVDILGKTSYFTFHNKCLILFQIFKFTLSVSTCQTVCIK